MARPQMSSTGKRPRLNLTIDPDVLADAKELLHGTGQSISDIVTELLKDKVAKARAKAAAQEGRAKAK